MLNLKLHCQSKYNTLITAIIIIFQSCWQWIPGKMVWIFWSTISMVHQLCTTASCGTSVMYHSLSEVWKCYVHKYIHIHTYTHKCTLYSSKLLALQCGVISHIRRKNISWICVQNPLAKQIDSDLAKAFQLWDDLREGQVKVTAERVKGV